MIVYKSIDYGYTLDSAFYYECSNNKFIYLFMVTYFIIYINIFIL